MIRFVESDVCPWDHQLDQNALVYQPGPGEYWHPVAGLSVYLCTNIFLRWLGVNLSQSTWFKAVVFSHNSALAIFSCWASCTTLSLLTVSSVFSVNGGAIFATPGLAKMVHLFYLSKYWEFFDTWIHYLKGGRPSGLQVFHHVGAVLVTALLAMHRVECVWVWPVCNGAVHAVMYSYYAGATVGLRFPFKSFITSLQITQFVVGLAISVWYAMFQRMTREQRATLFVNNVYVIVLLALFGRFYTQQYGAKHHKKSPRNIQQSMPSESMPASVQASDTAVAV